MSAVDKQTARDQLAAAFRHFTAAERARLVVRINTSGTPWHDDDLILLSLTARGLAGVMVPKAQTVEGLQRVVHAVHAVGPACALLPLVESVSGLDAANALGAGLWAR